MFTEAIHRALSVEVIHRALPVEAIHRALSVEASKRIPKIITCVTEIPEAKCGFRMRKAR